MGSSLITGCGSIGFNRKRSIRVAKGYEDEEEQLDDMDDGGMIQNNRDNYFTKEDFEKIAKRFPEYKEWMSQSSSSPLRLKSRQRINWKEGELIGHGSFGRVIMGLNLQTGCIMAVKQVQIGGSNAQSQQDRIKALEIEIDCLRHLSHKNIVQYYGSRKTKTTFNIFLEFISGGTIASLIEKYGPLNETLVRMYTRQILEGLEYLHVRNTVHRDIKGANVLVDNNGVCKLADFGTAKRISAITDGENKYMPSIKGTANWMAPEIIKQIALGRSADIWSVGCTVLEMLTGKAPWSHMMKPGTPQLATLYHIANAKTHPPLPAGLSPEATDFLKQCFKIVPSERSNVVKLLNHKFITGGGSESIARTTLQSVDLDKLKAALNNQSPFSVRVRRDSAHSIKITETTDKMDTPMKDKERFSFKQKPSFIMKSQESSIYPMEGLEEIKKAEYQKPKEKESKTKRELRKVLALDISSMRRDETPQRPRFTIRNTNETQNMSSNLDITNLEEKPLRDLRTVSTPDPKPHKHEKRALSESKKRLETQQPSQESRIEYKTQGTAPIPSIIDYTDTIEVSISAKEPSPMPRNTPLSNRRPGHRQFRRSELYGSFRQMLNSREEDFSSVNASALNNISRMSSGLVMIASPEVNSQHSRTKTFFNTRDMLMITKDLELTHDYKIEEQGVEEDEQQIVKPKEHTVYQNDKKPEAKPETPIQNPQESARSHSRDSDLELSVIHENQEKQSCASIKTVQMSEGFQGGESHRMHKKSDLSLKFSTTKDFSNALEEIQVNNDRQLGESVGFDLGLDTPFRGIVLTESLEMSKNFSTDNRDKVEEYPNSILNKEQVTTNQDPPNIENLTLSETPSMQKQVNDNWKRLREGSWRKRKHVLNNLFRSEKQEGAC